MKHEFDPEMEALGARRAKGMRIIVDVGADGAIKAAEEGKEELKEAIEEHEQDDEAQDRQLIAEMIKEQEEKEDAEEKDEYENDEKKVKSDIMGGYTDEDTMEEFKDRMPRTLGGKVRLAVAKKGMKA